MKKNILFFVAGAAIGAAVTYFVVKKQYEETLTRLEEELESDYNIQKSLRQATRRAEIENALEMGTSIHEGIEAGLKQDRQEYKKLVRRYDTGGQGRLEPVEDRTAMHPQDSDEDDGISIISLEEFSIGNPRQDKISLEYYALDEVLTEDGEVIDDIEDCVGRDNLEQFGYLSEDPDMLFIRNENTGIDYEIVRLDKSYADAMGLTTEEGEGDDE